jgi:hypothetical protein
MVNRRKESRAAQLATDPCAPTIAATASTHVWRAAATMSAASGQLARARTSRVYAATPARSAAYPRMTTASCSDTAAIGAHPAPRCDSGQWCVCTAVTLSREPSTPVSARWMGAVGSRGSLNGRNRVFFFLKLEISN